MIGYYLAAFLLAAISVLLVRWLILAATIKRTMLKSAAAPEPVPQRCDQPSQPIFARDAFARYADELRQHGFAHIANSEISHVAGGHQMWAYAELYGSEAQQAFAIVTQIVVPTWPSKGTHPHLSIGSYLSDGRVLMTGNRRSKWASHVFHLPTQILVRDPAAGTQQLLESHRKNLQMIAAQLHAQVAQELTWEFWRAKVDSDREARMNRKLDANPYWLALQYSIPQSQRVVWPGDCGIPASRFVLP